MFCKSLLRDARTTLHLAYPLVLGQVTQILLYVIDNVMVGRLGATELAASSFASSLASIPMVFGIGFSSCVATFSSRAHGAYNHDESARVFIHGWWMNSSIGIGLTFILLMLSPYLSRFGQPPEVVSLVPGFYQMLAWSMIPMMMFQSLRQFSEAMNRTFVPMIASVVGLLANALFNYFLIFGHGGFPAMGLTGSGVATLLSRILMCLVMGLYILTSPHFDQLRRRWKWFEVRTAMLKRLGRVGLPAGSQVLFEVGVFSAAAILMGWLGTHQLAAHQIAINIASITFIAVLGIGQAVSIRIGQQAGRGDLHHLRQTGLGGLLLVVAFMSAAALLIFALRHELPKLYVTDPDVRALASDLLIVAAFFQLFDGTQALAVCALRGLTDVKAPTIITFIAYWIVSLPVAYGLAFYFNWGGVGVWIGLCVGLIFSSFLLNRRFWQVTHPTHLRG